MSNDVVCSVKCPVTTVRSVCVESGDEKRFNLYLNFMLNLAFRLQYGRYAVLYGTGYGVR